MPQVLELAPGRRFDPADPVADPLPGPLPPAVQARAAATGELSWLLDPLGVVAGAALATLLHADAGALPVPGTGFAHEVAPAVWFVALLAPFVLRDRHFGALAAHGRWLALARGHALRFALLGLVSLGLGTLSGALAAFPRGWLLLWLSAGLLSTSLARLAAVAYLRRRQRQGGLDDIVAVVGAGPAAERLVQALQCARPCGARLLGVFDDGPAIPGAPAAAGSIERLIERGRTERIDCILLALPPEDETRLQAVVARLKSLAAPIAIAPLHEGIRLPHRSAGFIGERIAVERIEARPMPAPAGLRTWAGELLPRWVATTLGLLVDGLAALARRIGVAPPGPAPSYTFDAHDLDSFVAVAARHGSERYGFVVTPNADHLIRLHDDASFRALYARAGHVLLDSRFLSHLLRLTRGLRLPVCTGSDLTAQLFATVIAPDDAIVLVGGSAAQAEQLVRAHGLRRLVHLNPPMGFIHDPQAVEACLSFIEAHSPFRFCLLALGSPQQEVIAAALQERGRARGLALCIGASINFLTGDERRAPRWMQRSGCEWLYRLLQDPRRLAARYLVRGPRVFMMLRRARIVLRADDATSRQNQVAVSR